MHAGIIRSFKARYRQRLVRWLLDALHAKVTHKINLLEAVRFAIASWDDVPANVIQNCWIKCGIVPINVVLDLNQQRDYAKPVDDEVDTALAELMSSLGCLQSVEEFVEMDDDEQTTEEVVDVVEYPAQVNNESESDEEPVISASEALSCCVQLQSYLACTDDCDDCAKHIAQITHVVRGHCQERKKQVPITSYFNVV